jgi:hypothetical protein
MASPWPQPTPALDHEFVKNIMTAVHSTARTKNSAIAVWALLVEVSCAVRDASLIICGPRHSRIDHAFHRAHLTPCASGSPSENT